MNTDHLPPWRLSGMTTATRTTGAVGLNKNGSFIDIWIRVDGEARWFSISRNDLAIFLAGDQRWIVLPAGSDGNAEDLVAQTARMEPV